jgi:hypothetical protein
VGVTLKWLLGFLVQCFEALPEHLYVQPVSCQHDVMSQRLKMEADEMASFILRHASRCPELDEESLLRTLWLNEAEVAVCRGDAAAVDALWSFMGKKTASWWLRYALDHHSGKV